MKASCMLLVIALGTATAAEARGLKPGQYEIDGQAATQQICLVGDGTWYGTTFNWGGHWFNPPCCRLDTQLYGIYAIDGGSDGSANTTLSVVGFNGGLAAKWYDWLDDFSYRHYELAPISHVKNRCDPAFTDQNTKAASQ